MLKFTLLIASLLTAETHNFKEVNFYGTTLKNVSLVMSDEYTFDIWYKDKLLKRGEYMIVSCGAREKFCLVENDSSSGWIEEKINGR